MRRVFKTMSKAKHARLAAEVLRQAVEDLDNADVEISAHAENFLFGDDEMPLLRWLLRAGSFEVDDFRYSVRRLRKKLAA